VLTTNLADQAKQPSSEGKDSFSGGNSVCSVIRTESTHVRFVRAIRNEPELPFLVVNIPIFRKYYVTDFKNPGTNFGNSHPHPASDNSFKTRPGETPSPSLVPSHVSTKRFSIYLLRALIILQYIYIFFTSFKFPNTGLVSYLNDDHLSLI